MEKDYYKILIVGGSGRGKTYSFRNMDPATTGFINVEDKPFPFRGSFEFHKKPATSQEVLNAIQEYSKNPAVDCVVVDSFSAYMDLVLRECRELYKGFDIWSNYNSKIGLFNYYVKKVKKTTFVTAHYEVITDEGEGVKERRVKVKGREWEGMVEKDYTIVIFAESKFVESKRPEYFFSLYSDGNSSAKCPPEIFGEETLKIPNDSKEVLTKVREFSDIIT